jgi:hypothetical protein
VITRIIDWRFDEADRESQRSMELEPNNPMVLQWRGSEPCWRWEEATKPSSSIGALSPSIRIDMTVRSQLCRAVSDQAYDEAIVVGKALIQMDAAQSSAH